MIILWFMTVIECHFFRSWSLVMSLLLTVKRICVISSFPYYFMFLENIGPVAGRCSPTRGRPGSGATAAAGRQDVVTPRHSRRRSHRLMVRGRDLCDQVGVGGRSRAGAAGSAFKLRSPFVAGSRHGRPTCPPLPPWLGAPGSTAELPTSAAFSVLLPPPAPLPPPFPFARPPPQTEYRHACYRLLETLAPACATSRQRRITSA